MNNYTFNNAAGVLPRWLRQTLLVMRITALILLVGLLQVSASSLAQKISIDKKNTSIQSVLNEISKQSGYDFFYDANALKKIKPVSISIQNADLNEAVKMSLSGLPLSYSIENKTVVIKEKTPSFLEKVAAAFAADIEVRGQVVNKKTNEPLGGVSIKVRSKKVGTGTNSNGEFYLSKLDANATITFSYVGFDSVQVKLADIAGLQEGGKSSVKNGSINKVNGGYFIKLEMEPSVSFLDETIIQGYGTTDRRMATGNIAKVTAEEIEKQPVMNPLLALQGKVPGMVVTPLTGYASGVVKVEIRGRGTINSNFTSDPLYIIDGVPLTYLEIGGSTPSTYETGSPGVIQNGFPGAAGGQSPLFNLNPADIASIEVLKDADATAIYGSRGANGVILITTKKGKIGDTKITADVSQGISKVTRYWDLLNTQQYLAMRRQAFKNDGITPTPLNAPDLMVWDTTRYTNWQKELWGGTGKMTNGMLSISGGNENTQFRISGNYTRQTDILTASGANKRAGLAFNLSNYAMNRKFKTNLAVNYSHSEANNVATPNAVTLAPNAPPIFNSNGDINYQEWNDAGIVNPFSSIKDQASSQTNLLTANLNLAYELFKGFEMSSSFGYNNSNNIGGGIGAIATQNPLYNPTGSSTYLTNDNQNWIIEPQFNYKTDIGKGRFTALLGGTLQASKAASHTTIGFGYQDDSLLGSIGLAPFTMVLDKSGRYKYAAIFSRLNYTWDEKYVVNLSGRRDGSSRFGKGKQYGNFGALGLAWIASQESWIKNILPSYVSFLKLRASYGITGSDGINDYQYLTQWSSAIDNVALVDYGGVTPLVSLHAINPDYRWQENKKTEVGLSASFLKDKINLEVAYYSNRCDNQLVLLPMPILTGFESVTANSPADVRNSGWEFSLSAKLIGTKNFSWSVNLNGSVNKNILLNYPDIEHSPYYTRYYVGKPLNAQYLLHYTGINPLTGEYTFEDHDGDGNVRQKTQVSTPGTDGDDRYITANLDPKFVGGFGNNFQYKNWNLSLFFMYKNQLGYNSSFPGIIPGDMNNIPLEMYNNHWEQPGQQAKYARFTTKSGGASDSYISNSDLKIVDASFLRLNNVSLSYTLPQKVMGNNRGLNVFVHAQNLWVFTKYKGIDPDIQSFASMPTAKVITAGFSLTL